MRQVSQIHDGMLDLIQLALSHFAAGVIDDPTGDRVEVPYLQWMEPDPIVHRLRAA